MKENIAVILAILAFIILCGLSYYLLIIKETPYYSIIDNTQYEKINEREYRYSLVSYQANGKAKRIKFVTTRELIEGAYIKLDVMFLRGVVRWEEVDYNDIPKNAQIKIPKISKSVELNQHFFVYYMWTQKLNTINVVKSDIYMIKFK